MGTDLILGAKVGVVDIYNFDNEQSNLTNEDGSALEIQNRTTGAAIDLEVFGRTRLGDSIFNIQYGVGLGTTLWQKKSFEHMIEKAGGEQADVDPSVDCDFDPEACAANNDEKDEPSQEKTTTHMRANRNEIVFMGGPVIAPEDSPVAGGLLIGYSVGSFWKNGAALTQTPDGINNATPTNFNTHGEFILQPQVEYRLGDEGANAIDLAVRFGWGSALGEDDGVGSGGNQYKGTNDTRIMLGYSRHF